MSRNERYYTLPPPDSWDSHVHVVDESRFPLHPLHSYRPQKATVFDLQDFHSALGIEQACLVVVSVYDTDSRSILDALSILKKQGKTPRAVVTINVATITDDELNALHHAGVRGVRLNLHTRGDAFDGESVLSTATRIKRLDWVIQLHIALDQVPELAPLVPDLGVAVVLDHLGTLSSDNGPVQLQRGYREFMDMLRSGLVYTKLSGTYRFANVPGLDDYVLGILRAAPDRVVWASDWPHTGGVGANAGGDRTKVQEYRKIDDQEWVERCLGMVSNCTAWG